MRVFPLSNWTELDVWTYIYLEDIPVVPLYFAAERPVVERGGMLIMVDDDRLPLDAGEQPSMRLVRFRTLGCYPLSGAIEFECRDRAGDHRGAGGGAGHRNAKAASSIMTSRVRWRRRSKKGISDATLESRRQTG